MFWHSSVLTTPRRKMKKKIIKTTRNEYGPFRRSNIGPATKTARGRKIEPAELL